VSGTKFHGSLIGHLNRKKALTSQTQQVLKISRYISGLGFKDSSIGQTAVYLTDLKDFPAMNRIYAEKFSHAVKQPCEYTRSKTSKRCPCRNFGTAIVE